MAMTTVTARLHGRDGREDRVQVFPIRDPDTRRVLGYVAQCFRCTGYAITKGHGAAMTLGHHHRCGHTSW